jgi:hypothetical protein
MSSRNSIGIRFLRNRPRWRHTRCTAAFPRQRPVNRLIRANPHTTVGGVLMVCRPATASEKRRSWDSVVGIATGYELDDRVVGVRVSVWSRIFSTSSRRALGPTQPPSQWVPRVKRPGHEADHSPPTNAEVKKTWIYTAIPPYVFMV